MSSPSIERNAQADQADSIVSLKDVRFSYGSQLVLDNLNFSVAPAESVAVVGRSGAGKSTVLKLINRLLLPDAGHVYVQGRDTREWDPIALRRQTGYVLRSEEHTSELQSRVDISYAVFC